MAVLHHPPAQNANKDIQVRDHTPMTRTVMECPDDTEGRILNAKMISDIYIPDTYEKDITTKVSKMEKSLRKEALSCSGQSISLTLSSEQWDSG